MTTDDEVRGQFTIPGLRTFNVVTDNRQPDENRNIRRRNQQTSNRHDMTSETDTDQTSDRHTDTSNSNPDTRADRQTVEHEAGDLSEPEVNINVRYLDESVMNCSFRPSQSLGHFKCK